MLRVPERTQGARRHDPPACTAGQRELRGAVAKTIRIAIDEGHLEPQTDPWQFTFELFGIVLATHHDFRLLGDARALERAGDALERLIEAHRAAAARA